MIDFNFKVGDTVYCPSIANTVLALSESSRTLYPIRINDEVFTSCGRVHTFDPNPSIFPATQEWYDKLILVYPNLEKPCVKRPRKEIIQAMLDDGWVRVPCRVGDHKGVLYTADLISYVVGFGEPTFVGSSAIGHEWNYAEPFDPHTGKSIIDYVDGEVVFEE